MLSLSAKSHKIMGGPGFSLECDVIFENTTSEAVVFSISNAEFTVYGPHGVALDHHRASNPPDATLMQPGEGRTFNYSFITTKDRASSVSLSIAGERAVADL